ncbi:MAG: RNHCP domain-containing protein [Candidatus Gracilibacteria bacterium]|nr:RNHCP domain-containing protein [Candidatus Gracilibacteria bacterium]
MGFKMINESFVCENCHNEITQHPEGSARNHCPFCLYSKHMDDNFPGDRASKCHGLMIPVDIDYKKNKGNMIKHKCTKCGKEILNKVAPDDEFLEFIKKRNKMI